MYTTSIPTHTVNKKYTCVTEILISGMYYTQLLFVICLFLCNDVHPDYVGKVYAFAVALRASIL